VNWTGFEEISGSPILNIMPRAGGSELEERKGSSPISLVETHENGDQSTRKFDK
jgi:hypothetical protein